MAEEPKWYVVHTYSGYENKVKATIEKNVAARNLGDQILECTIPMETVTEFTEDGGTKTVDRKLFPGYVLVKMFMSDDTWYVIRSIRGVTGFVGSETTPTPLTEDEVYQLGVEKREYNIAFQERDSVRIVDGPLDTFIGVVEELDLEHEKVRVVVSMFGRETPVELELGQVEALSD